MGVAMVFVYSNVYVFFSVTYILLMFNGILMELAFILYFLLSFLFE